MTIRQADGGDLPEIRRILTSCPEAAQWPPGEESTLVAEGGAGLAGLLVWRDLGCGELEILNLAVDPVQRRQGVAKSLVLRLFDHRPKAIFLEVREGNRAARAFYEALGFQHVATRKDYYTAPPAAAVVMKWSSC